MDEIDGFINQPENTSKSPKVSLKVPELEITKTQAFEFKIQLAAVSNIENPNLAALIETKVVDIEEEGKVKKIMSKSFNSYDAAGENAWDKS